MSISLAKVTTGCYFINMDNANKTRRPLIHVSKLTAARLVADHPGLADLVTRERAALRAMHNAEGMSEYLRLNRLATPLCNEVTRERNARYSIIV